MNIKNEMLFCKYELREVLEGQERELYSEIEKQDRNYILNVSIEDFCDYLEEKYKVNALDVIKDKIYIKETGEAKIDLRQTPNRIFFDNEPHLIKGTYVIFAIPFTGDAKLFFCRASTYSCAPPYAHITDGEVLIIFKGVDLDANDINARMQKELADIEQNNGYVNNDLQPFNENLRTKIINKIRQRREKLLRDQGMVAALGYPIKKTSDVPVTYAVPHVQRKILPKPQATSVPFVPEPTLDMDNYEVILKIIYDMVLVIERSPHTFVNIKEEDLRQHFLIQLNGQYQGNATGETFNFHGKTDILIRHEGKNIFIAECMFWKGQKSLENKIDQLLGYISWRDTKTAILIFNRNRDFSNVLSKISEIVNQHKNFKRQMEYNHETGYRFVLHQPNDKNREMILTVLAFDIPIIEEDGVES